MKVVCSKESLLKALSIAENVISNKNTLSVYSNVLLSADNGNLNIKASEITLNFSANIPVEVVEPGSVAVYCNNLFTLIRKFNDTEIEISSDENNIVYLKQHNKKTSEYKHKGIDAKDFPVIEIPSDVNFFSIKMEILSDMIRKTLFAVANDATRKYISGVLFEKSGDTIRMVSTDGKRLSFVKNEVALTNVEDCQIIVPPKVLNEILKLSNGNGDVQLALNNKNLYIKIDSYLFISNLFEGTFPPYGKVIPTEFVGSVVLDRKMFYEILDRIATMGDKEANKVVLSFYDNTVAVFAENQAFGSGREEMAIEYGGTKMDIALNIRYLMDILNVATTPNIIIYFKDAHSTMAIKQENDLNFIYVLMPMTLN